MGNEQIFQIFCPRCHLATLKPSYQSRGYNKCTFCGYTEEEGKTDQRTEEWLVNVNKKPKDFK